MTSSPVVTVSRQRRVSTDSVRVARQQLSQNVYYRGRTAIGRDDRERWNGGSQPGQRRDRYSRRGYCRGRL